MNRLLVLVMLVPVLAVADTGLEGLEFHHGIAFYHELKNPEGFLHLDYLNPEAPKGGTLILPTQSNFDTLAPAAERGSSAPGRFFHEETLITRAGDELSGFYGRLADGIAITDDRLTLVFRIHPQAKWRDGVPITSKDVGYTVRMLMSQVSGRIYFHFFKGVTEIDDRHVAIHLKSPVQLPAIMIIGYIGIMPEHYWRDRDPSVPTLTPSLSGGPYEVTEVKQGRYIEYRRDPEYWGRDIPVNKGRFNFDTIRFEVYRDATVTREAFRKGLVDIWEESDARYWHNGFDTPAFHKGLIKKIRRKQGLEVGVRQGIVLNNRRAKFSDRRVREALTLAVDFEWQNSTLHFDFHQRAHSYWPETILSATGLPSDDELELLSPYREQLPEELFQRPFRFPEVTMPRDYRTNMVRARRLLDEAGWHVVDGVLRNAAGEAFEIDFLSRSGADARTLLPYFQRLEQLGIRGRLVLVDGASQWVNRLREFNFDALLDSMRIQMPPGIGLQGRFHSSSSQTYSPGNKAGISHPVLDMLVDKANTATTLTQLVAACRALDRVLLWQYYQIPLYAVSARTTVHWDKFGRPDYEPRYQPAFPDGWWYEPKKAARITGEGS